MTKIVFWACSLCCISSALLASRVSAQDMSYNVDDQEIIYEVATGEASFTVDVYGDEDVDAGDEASLTQGFSLAVAYDNTVLAGIDLTLGDTFADMNDEAGPSFVVLVFAEDDEGVVAAVVYQFASTSEAFGWEGGETLFSIEFETVVEEFEDNEDGLDTLLEFVDDELVPIDPSPPTNNVVTIDGASSFPEFNNGTITLVPDEVAPIFIRGDFDGDGIVQTVADPLRLLRWGFSGGEDPPCFDAADANDDDEVSALPDALYLLRWAFTSGDAPPDPGVDECGVDPTDDDLDCEVEPDC